MNTTYFPKVIHYHEEKYKQPRPWTWASDSISYDDNRYSKQTSSYLPVILWSLQELSRGYPWTLNWFKNENTFDTSF